jgi:hypothetical protein
VEQGRARRRVSRRVLSSPSSVEAYLQAGVIPRFIERARQIEDEKERQRIRVERAYEWMRGKYADDPELFAEHWRAMAERWSFDDVNALIAEHNRWYPAERRLPLNPRTGDYITVGNRPWQREPLDAAWILERFPPSL